MLNCEWDTLLVFLTKQDKTRTRYNQIYPFAKTVHVSSFIYLFIFISSVVLFHSKFIRFSRAHDRNDSTVNMSDLVGQIAVSEHLICFKDSLTVVSILASHTLTNKYTDASDRWGMPYKNSIWLCSGERSRKVILFSFTSCK